MTPDLCLLCGFPTRWHLIRGRLVDCAELRVQITRKVPKYRSCAKAMQEYMKLPKRYREGK